MSSLSPEDRIKVEELIYELHGWASANKAARGQTPKPPKNSLASNARAGWLLLPPCFPFHLVKASNRVDEDNVTAFVH